MTEAAVDHRRATAQRNAASIVDAAERLLARRTPLSIVAIAAEAGVSRPTLYAHYRSIPEIVEAAVERSVVASLAAFEEARPEDGPAHEALLRMAEASWQQLGRYEALARGAAEHLPAGAVHRSHQAMLAPLQALVDRQRHRDAETHLLEGDEVAGGEADEHDDDDQRGAGDQARGGAHALDQAVRRAPRLRVALADAAEQEHLVVHGQPEQHAEQEDGD